MASVRAKAARAARLRPSRFGSLSALGVDLEQGEPLEPEQADTPDAPSLPMLPIVQDSYARPTYSTPPARWVAVPDALYWPEREAVLVDGPSGRTVVEESLGTWPTNRPLSSSVLWRRPRRLEGASTVFRSLRNGHYHTLVDNLPRIALLHDPALAGMPLRVLHCGPLSPAESYLLERLLPPNATLHAVERGSLLRIETLVFPLFVTRRFAGYHHRAVRRLLADRVVPHRASARCHRIYVSRAPSPVAAKRCITNEDELLPVLRRFGFERHVLDEMDIGEEVALFHDAELVVAAHGAGLANIMWARDISVLELFPARVHPCYYFLARSYGHSWDYLAGSGPNRNSPFAVDVRAVERALVDRFALRR